MKLINRKMSFFLFLGLLPVFGCFSEASAQNSGVNSKVVKRFPTNANQGVAVDNNYYYTISNTRITKHEKQTGTFIAEWSADLSKAEYKHFKHMNSGTVVGDLLYVAHSRYKEDPNNNTLEIFNVKGSSLTHKKTISMPGKYGSFTWADKHADGSWWICYAVYGKGLNQKTKLVKCKSINDVFVEEKSWFFPKEVVENWGDMSCSGGSWGPDGKLYTTGHDYKKAFVLEVDNTGQLIHVETKNNMGFFGQAIAWDRYSSKPLLWGIEKRKWVSATQILLEK